MKTILKILSILTKRQIHMYALLVILMFVGAALESLGIGALYPLISVIGNPHFFDAYPQVQTVLHALHIETHQQIIIFLCIGLIAFYVLKNIFILLQSKLQIAFSVKNQKEYTNRLYRFYMQQPYLYHVNTNIATIQWHLSSGGKVIFSDILVALLSLITECITALIIWGMLLIVDTTIGLLVALVLAPVILLIMKLFRKVVNKRGVDANRYSQEVNKWINQGFGSLKETKVMQKEAFFSEQFAIAYKKSSDSNASLMFIDKIPRALIEMIGIIGILAIVIVKILLGTEPAAIVPSLGVLALAAIRLMPSMNRVISLFNTIKSRMPVFDELYDAMLAIKDEKSQPALNAPQTKTVPLAFCREIEVRDLCFQYPNTDRDVLKGISFVIPKGTFVGIVGSSGAGKTTFVDLLLGLLLPKSGTILADGTDIYQHLSRWLDHIAYVPQTIYLIDGTIEENIALGIPQNEISPERIETVLRMAELYDFVATLPQHLKTNVGDRGAKLSGGQKQRIGIARALYNNPAVLVLDEATSALDNETEKSITDTILKLKGKITIISIAHRLSTLESCDFRIHFEGGAARVESTPVFTARYNKKIS